MMLEHGLHADMEVLLSQRKATAPASQSLEARRAAWTAYSRTLAQPRPPGMRVEDVTLAMPHRQVPVRIYRPADPACTGLAPCTIYLHGGGFVLGDLDSSDFIAWGIAEQARCIVVSVDYALSPEHPFPAAFDDTCACMAWVARHGEEWGMDPNRLAIAGDSAGANLAAAACLASRDRGGPRLLAQALAYPWLTHDDRVQSRKLFALGPGLTTAGLRDYGAAYIGEAREPLGPYAWPLQAQDLSGLPPALIHTAARDPVRDDGREYAARLCLAGVDVCHIEAPGTIHAFLRARFAGPMAAAQFARFAAFLRRRLHA